MIELVPKSRTEVEMKVLTWLLHLSLIVDNNNSNTVM